MHTACITIDPEHPSEDAIADAASLINNSELVAFPTETVYGLGANALSEDAVKKIYDAKGRPAHNPVIVHVASVAQAKELSSAWTESAENIAEAFWPGPITIVVPRSSIVPDIITAGGDTVAIRMPSHPIARALITAAKTPIAAPSANLSSGVSSTKAEHVRKQFDGSIPMILDGGQTSGGLESTVVDCSGDDVVLLRPGLITQEQIETALGHSITSAKKENGVLRSPGMLDKHYAPHANVILCDHTESADVIADLKTQKKTIGHLSFGTSSADHVIAMSKDVKQYSAALYDALHTLDENGVDVIVIDRPPQESAWHAVHDRLTRAAV